MRRRRKGHLFSSKKQSYPGLLSFILGLISIVSLILVIYRTFLNDGKALLQYGAVVFLCLLFALCGLIAGILARREPERVYVFAWLGVVLNSVVLALCFVIMYLGLM